MYARYKAAESQAKGASFWVMTFSRLNVTPSSGTVVETTKVPATITVPHQAKKGLFALIIGIDAYAYPSAAHPLQGAVKDATDMRDYLTKNLEVPNSQIRFLIDDDAKRADIIAEFQKIRDDTRIKQNDPILIYYAGHGYEMDAPTGWPSEDVDNQIQLLVPQDYSTDAATRVHGIPDYTLGALVNEIAEKHGDNITVIFDSCHSGSGTRGLNRVRKLTRGQRQPIPPNLDQDIWSPASHGMASATAFSTNGSSSHVLLSACTQKEEVADSVTGGKFTQGLLRVLISRGVNKLTYVSLLHRMDKISGQNPQCKGDNRDRIIFEAKFPTTRGVCFPIKMNGKAYEMQAGTANGITQGAEFSLYNDSLALDESKPLCILVVESASSIGEFTTTLRIKRSFGAPVTLSDTSCVLQTKAGEVEDFLIYVPLKFKQKFDKLCETLVEMKEFQLESRHIRPIFKPKYARLGLLFEEGKIIFENLDPLLTEYGFRRMPHPVENDPGDIIPILHAAAHFFLHLNRYRKAKNDKVANAVIEIECHTLAQTNESHSSGRSIIGVNLIHGGIMEIEASAHTMYGYTITNRSTRDLYLNAYYFDNTDFSIVSYYQSATGGRRFESYPSLPGSPDNRRFSSLRLGYGPGDERFTYSLKNGVDIAVGYLVFIITDVNINLSDTVPQETPFRAMARGSVQVKPHALPVLGTRFVQIVCRRPKASRR